jgi:hypothetical protein
MNKKILNNLISRTYIYLIFEKQMNIRNQFQIMNLSSFNS